MVALPAVGIEPAWPMQVVPLSLVAALAVEDLHAVVLAVGHVHEPIPVGGDVVREVELAGIGAGLAPREQMLAVGRVLVDAGVAVAVGQIEVARPGTDGDVGGPVERLAALERGRGVGIADGEEELALRRELAAGVV
jgi:hypothetical protein